MAKKTLVFGVSLKAHRISNMAVGRLLRNGHEVVAFGMKVGEVNGVRIDNELILYEDVDTVTLYINPSRQEHYFSHIIALNPRRVIFNPGTENMEFYRLLMENDITIDVSCTLTLLATDQY